MLIVDYMLRENKNARRATGNVKQETTVKERERKRGEGFRRLREVHAVSQQSKRAGCALSALQISSGERGTRF
jgi:hypothetical protein